MKTEYGANCGNGLSVPAFTFPQRPVFLEKQRKHQKKAIIKYRKNKQKIRKENTPVFSG